MRQFAFGLPAAVLALLAGCSGGAQSPASTALPTQAPATTSTASLGASMINGDLVQTASAMYRLNIDPATLSATLSLVESRAAQKNEDIYDLSVDAFFGPGTIEISNINGSPTSVDVSFTVKHPFNAPTNLAGPVTAGNRADLGVSTRLLFVAEAPGSAPTYFAGAGDVVANTDLMPKANGYMDPGGMIVDPGTTANVFPFMAVIDELADNRIGASNLSNVAGNFDPTNGWTQANMGATRDQWTGFGILHQGQSAIVDTSFDIAALGDLGGFQLNVIPIVKYNDPRQGANAATKRANRLPPATPDATKFGYRMPHGAMDIEKVNFDSESGGLVANTITATDINFYVVDWDARATETTQAVLSDDLTLGNVFIGESGAPTVEVEIPGVISTAATLTATDDDSALGGDAGIDSGVPGDALYYTANITNTGTGQDVNGETVVGLAKVTDIEAGAAFNDTWHFALDSNLTPLAANIPEPIVYQAFSVELGANNQAPTYTTATGPAQAGNGGTWTVNINGLADLENDDLDLEIDWDNNGTYTPEGTVTFPYANPATRVSPITYTYTGPGVDTRTVPIRFTDGINTVAVTPSPTFTVNACAGASLTSAPLSGTIFSLSASLTVQGADYSVAANNIVTGDMATIRNPISTSLRGTVFQQLRVVSSTFSEFRRDVGSGFAETTMTSFAPNLAGIQVTQIEIDSTNRVLFATNTSSLVNGAPPSARYTAGSGAAANIRYFNYTGAVVPWASVSTISTGANLVVAMALDQSDNVYMIDTTNVLHKYTKTAAYAEDLTGGYPIDLKAAPYNLTLTGSGAGDRKVHDFILDWRTNSMYILTQSLEAATAPGNGYVLRIDCDLSVPATVAGNANPYRMILTDSTTQALPADITIDQLSTGNTVLPLKGSSQIIVTGQNTSAAVNDYTFLDTNLTKIGGRDYVFYYPGAATVTTDNYVFALSNSLSYVIPGVAQPPTGWE